MLYCPHYTTYYLQSLSKFDDYSKFVKKNKKVQKNKKRRLRDSISEILKYWTEMEFIDGFEFLYNNREIEKILIILSDEKLDQEPLDPI